LGKIKYLIFLKKVAVHTASTWAWRLLAILHLCWTIAGAVGGEGVDVRERGRERWIC